MTLALRALLDYFEPAPPTDKGLGDRLYREFIRKTKIEIAVAAVFTGLACYFAKTNELRLTFITKAVTVLSVTLIARAVATGCQFAAFVDKRLFFRTVSFGVDCSAPFYFARGLTWTVIQPFVHEGGHFLFSYLLSRGNNVEIIANSLHSWVAHSSTTGYSSFGNLLGPHYSKMVFLAGGTLTTVIVSQVALALGLHIKNSYSDLSKYFLLTSVFSLVQEFNYARSALTASESNDFLQLWKEGGLHPWAAMAAIIALPVISTAGYLSNKGVY